MATRIALAAGVGLLILAQAGSAAAQRGYFDPAKTFRVPVGSAPSRGPADAPVTIVEFSDFQCRFCVRSQAVLSELMALYPGQLRLVFRHNPLDPEDGSLPAEASLAAAEQGQFWAMHHRLFANPVNLDRAALDGYALELGLDMVRFRSALDERRLRPAVLEASRRAHKLGLSSTPMFFINGRPVKGARPLGVFVRLIEEELARARELESKGVAARDLYQTITRGGLPAGEPLAQEPVYPVAELVPGSRYRIKPALPGHSRGPAGAPVTLVTFSDFECGYCGVEAPRLRALEQRFPGQLRVEYRHLPLPFHKNAQLAAEAAVAAAEQGKFWQLHDLMFVHKGPLTRPVIDKLARDAGLDIKALRAALDDRRYRSLVIARAARAKALGISGTPTMFINGTPVVGAVPLDQLARAVEDELARAKELLASGVAQDQLPSALLKDADVAE